eukprot:9496829-Pyramimonas_sp.AAC.1
MRLRGRSETRVAAMRKRQRGTREESEGQYVGALVCFTVLTDHLARSPTSSRGVLWRAGDTVLPARFRLHVYEIASP